MFSVKKLVKLFFFVQEKNVRKNKKYLVNMNTYLMIRPTTGTQTHSERHNIFCHLSTFQNQNIFNFKIKNIFHFDFERRGLVTTAFRFVLHTDSSNLFQAITKSSSSPTTFMNEQRPRHTSRLFTLQKFTTTFVSEKQNKNVNCFCVNNFLCRNEIQLGSAMSSATITISQFLPCAFAFQQKHKTKN